jgi:hypothetical protein
MEALGRLGDARFFRDREEGAQVSEIHGGAILYQIRILRPRLYWSETEPFAPKVCKGQKLWFLRDPDPSNKWTWNGVLTVVFAPWIGHPRHMEGGP